jgi:hypothetical protein
MRSPGFTPTPWDAPGATRFVVRFLPQESGVAVELETTDPSGARSLRTVPAQDCSEAIRASAWILTLLVDPSAAAAAGATPLETEPSTRTNEPVVAPPMAPPTAQARATNSPAQTSAIAPQASAPPPPASEDPPEPRAWQISVGGFGGVLQTALPETPLGFGVFVEWAWERESWLRPSARLAGLDAGSGVADSERGSVDVSFAGGRLSLCPVRTSRRHLVSARFCALAELGKLSGQGQTTDDPGSAAPTWYAAGPAFGAELQPWSFLALELEAALIFPFNRDRFVFEPDPVQAAYEVPWLSGSVALGAALRF